MKKFPRHTKNLAHDYEFIYSYKTKVAAITDDGIKILGYWSQTTSRHINYAAKQLDLIII